MSNKNVMRELFEDERGILSSKRILGTICVLVLCVISLATTFVPEFTGVPEYIITTIASLAFGLLGLSTVDKFTAPKETINDKVEE